MTQRTRNTLDVCFIVLIVAALAFCLLLAAGCSMLSAVPNDVRQNADLVAAMTRQDYELAIRSNASLQRLERERNKRDAAENVRATVGSSQPIHLADSLALDDARRPAAVDAGTNAALDPLNTAIREQGAKIAELANALKDGAGKAVSPFIELTGVPGLDAVLNIGAAYAGTKGTVAAAAAGVHAIRRRRDPPAVKRALKA